MKINTSMFDNNTASIIIAILVGAYAVAISKYELPQFMKDLFKNNIFKCVFLSLLLVFTYDLSPNLAIALALIFVLTLHYMNIKEAEETFTWLEAYESI